MDYANVMVDMFQLTTPPNTNYYADWPQYRPLDGARRTEKGALYHRYQFISERLREKDCDFEPTRVQGHYWEKPICYTAACMAMSKVRRGDAWNLIDKIANLMAQDVDRMTNELMEARGVRRAAYEWLKQTCRILRASLPSLTPTKRASQAGVPSQEMVKTPTKTSQSCVNPRGSIRSFPRTSSSKKPSPSKTPTKISFLRSGNRGHARSTEEPK